jgi:hypothetical protein
MVWWPFATQPERADTSEVTDLHSGAPPLYSVDHFGIPDFRRSALALAVVPPEPVLNAGHLRRK